MNNSYILSDGENGETKLSTKHSYTIFPGETNCVLEFVIDCHLDMLTAELEEVKATISVFNISSRKDIEVDFGKELLKIYQNYKSSMQTAPNTLKLNHQ